MKHDDRTIYLVRETKATKDFLKLRSAEADKVKCGVGVDFAVVTSAGDV